MSEPEICQWCGEEEVYKGVCGACGKDNAEEPLSEEDVADIKADHIMQEIKDGERDKNGRRWNN